MKKSTEMFHKDVSLELRCVSYVLVPVRIIFFQPAISPLCSTCHHKIRRCSQIGLEVSMRKTRHGGSRAQMLGPGWSL